MLDREIREERLAFVLRDGQHRTGAAEFAPELDAYATTLRPPRMPARADEARSTQGPRERVPWGSDASVFWQQQLFGVRCPVVRCPCCDDYLEGLWHDRDIAFHAHYCGLCKMLYFVSHALSDWLWQRHDDHSVAVWFAVPCPLRSLRTPEGDKYMRGVWHEDP